MTWLLLVPVLIILAAVLITELRDNRRRKNRDRWDGWRI